MQKKLAELSKLNSQFQWRLSGASLLQNLQIVIFLNFERNYFGWLSEKSRQGFQAAFYLSIGTICRKFFRKVFASLWTFFRIISSNWAGKVWPACQNCILRIYRIILKKKTVLENNWNFSLFSDIEQELFGFFSSFLTWMLELHSRCPKNILTKNSFFSNFFSLLDTERFFWPILAKKLAELSKLNSQFQWRLSGASLLQNLQIVIFLNFERNYFGWLSEKSQRGFQAALYLSIGTIWRKFFRKVCASLWTFFRIISSNWAGKVWPACQNCILRIYRIFLKKKLFWKQLKFFIIFRHWAGTFRLLFEFFDVDVGAAFYVSKTTL